VIPNFLILRQKLFSNLYDTIYLYLEFKVASLNPPSGSDEVYAIQHYVIKFVSDLRQDVGFFLWVLRFLPPIKLTATI